ncbi:histidine kinase [Streptomyces palmae]|uniref:Sensor histidine kinase n=1 Tax=Streptomyces palmae TaxID=1701085 RepID=A0A4Z0HCP7_9ACTN|nr:histidine kinase [Streptomyces palmae]TGB08786.1 sensor histidine kinase [Streptomyces palmae]
MIEDPSTGRNPVMIGEAPVTRRQLMVKMAWLCAWLCYLIGPVAALVADDSLGRRIFGGVGLLLFVGTYFLMVLRHMAGRALTPVRLYGLLALQLALSVALPLALGPVWLALSIFTSVACGVVLPWPLGRWAIPAVALVALATGLPDPGFRYTLFTYTLPGVGSGFVMVGIQHLIRTTRELQEARATVAHLAANEERLRLARDLHDLLGHSLSLVTLKSELAGRMLPDRPEQAAQQVADIERVSRQALVDVREAVSGFRRPTLAAELAGARIALAAGGVDADLSRAGTEHPDLPPDEEGALAWALREAVTNVVRHSGARHCTVVLAETADDELCLTVSDNGRGPQGGAGNGLTGLTERLHLADGRLEAGPGRQRGFVLRAWVPLSRRAAPQPTALG